MEFHSWLTQPLLVDLSAVSGQWQQDVCELQQNEVVKTLFKINGTMWCRCPRNVKRNALARVAYFGKTKTDKFSIIFGQMWGYSQGYHWVGLENKDDQNKTIIIGIFFIQTSA